MKPSLTCDECEGRAIWHLTPVIERDLAAGPGVRMPIHRYPNGHAVGSFELYFCKQCGLTHFVRPARRTAFATSRCTADSCR